MIVLVKNTAYSPGRVASTEDHEKMNIFHTKLAVENNSQHLPSEFSSSASHIRCCHLGVSQSICHTHALKAGHIRDLWFHTVAARKMQNCPEAAFDTLSPMTLQI